MSEESDVEMHSLLKKMKKHPKPPKSPTEDILNPDQKKVSTKQMIHEALLALKSRKGTSLYAIKKFIAEKYKVDTERFNYIIKKLIKTGVEAGTIIQTKGVGATGSFKLATEKKAEKKKTKPKKPTQKAKKTEKQNTSKNKEESEKVEKKIEKKVKKTKNEVEVETKTSKVKKVTLKEKNNKEVKDKNTKSKMAKVKMTPAKKRAVMMKRKSIGSIIKPPKMKPKAKS